MSTTLTPFLYQTRTLQRLHLVPTVRRSLSRACFHTPSSLRARGRESDDSIPFDLPSDVQDEARRTADPAEHSDKLSTITPAERRAFDAIFQEIASRGVRSSNSDIADNVINLVVQDATNRPSSTSSNKQSNVLDRDAVLEKFPPSLRQAASLALGELEDVNHNMPYGPAGQDLSSLSREDAAARRLGQGDVLDWEDDSAAIDQMVKSATIGDHRRREQQRVERYLADASSDFQLWKTMTKNIFRMVEKLGIGERPVEQEAPSSQSAQDLGATEPKRNKLNVYVHGPLYPLLLLKGLRLLDKTFEKSSPLALSVLPRVKELGLASYVLGASTPLYNTLMSIYWYRYGDVNAVFNLLEEMRRAGLSFDEDSLQILHDMDDTMVPYSEGESGPFVKELAAMPEYEAVFDSRFSHWESIIQGAIDEKRRMVM